jgi:hypothetical protein
MNIKRLYFFVPIFIITCVFLLIEFAIRIVGPNNFIVYEFGEQEFVAARQYMDFYPIGDISFLGSSKDREAINVPQLKQLCMAKLNKSYDIRNYAVSAAKASDIKHIASYMFSKEKAPIFVFYGITPRSLIHRDGRYDYIRTQYFWSISDVWREFTSGENWRKTAAKKALPQVIRNHLGKYILSLEFNRYPSVFFNDLLTKYIKGKNVLYRSCPMKGELTYWHKYSSRRRNLVSKPYNKRRLERLRTKTKKRFVTNGKLIIPDNSLIAIAEMAAMARERHSRLILYESPVSPLLKQYLPSGSYDAFIHKIKRFSKKNNIDFFTLDEINFQSRNQDFQNHSHLGWEGHLRFTKRFFQNILFGVLKSNHFGKDIK